MTLKLRTAIAGAIVVGAIGLLAGFWWAKSTGHAPTSSAANGSDQQHRALYWYDPMVPAQHFDKPGKSPFMDMQLAPKCAATAEAPSGKAVPDAASGGERRHERQVPRRGGLAAARDEQERRPLADHLVTERGPVGADLRNGAPPTRAWAQHCAR